MAAGKMTQGAVAPDKKMSQGAWEQIKTAVVTMLRLIADTMDGNAGLMR